MERTQELARDHSEVSKIRSKGANLFLRGIRAGIIFHLLEQFGAHMYPISTRGKNVGKKLSGTMQRILRSTYVSFEMKKKEKIILRQQLGVLRGYYSW
jgi:uncharacterized C2H2 Zn-finger protein